MAQVSLVTGAGSGIGRAVALRLAAHGPVALVDLDATAAGRVADEITAAGRIALSIGCDVTDESAVTAAFHTCEHQLGTARRIFTGAGIERNAAPDQMPYETWRAVLTTNLDGTFLVCRQAIRRMRGVGGTIVCASSPAAFVGFAGGGNGAYAASKGGVSALVRSLALDCAADGIRVNAVVPGATDTPMLWSQLPAPDRAAAAEQVHAAAREQIPLGRLADPDEIASAVEWLLGDAASYVTGAHLVCDGGLLAKGANTF